MFLSESAFIALLKAIILLALFVTQGQSAADKVRRQIPSLSQSQQKHLPSIGEIDNAP